MRDRVRVEGAGTLFGSAEARVPFTDFVQGFALSHGLNFVLANALVRVPFHAQRLTVTARAGAGVLLPHTQIEFIRERTEEYQLAGPAHQISGGIELRIRGPIRALAEYRWSHACARIELGEGGEALLGTCSHHLVFGVTATF